MRLFGILTLICSLGMFAGCSPDSSPATGGGETESSAPETAAPAENAPTENAPEAAAPLNEKYRPMLYAELPDDCYGPDALCYDAKSKSLYLSVPNFLFGESELPKTASFLTKVGADGSVEKIFEFPIREGEVKIGSMGIEFGPDGNLYVCDNQYFFDPNYKSRVWRVPFADGKPTGEFQLVADGLKVANAILWDERGVFVTDTILDEPGKYGSGGIWLFPADEFLRAGTNEENPPIHVAVTGDPRMIIIEDCDDIGRENTCGADGICRDSKGIYYFGNYGDGGFYRFRFGDDGKPEVEKVHRGGELFRCVDGICYDPVTDKVYITDSADNSIWTLQPAAWGEPVKFEKLWENGDTDGADGSLDLPCECRVVEGKLIITNQDCPVGASGKNRATDKPYSLSAIAL